MAGIKINTAIKVTPQCYAYTTPGVPAHDGWTKIGFTERMSKLVSMSRRIRSAWITRHGGIFVPRI